MMVRIILLAEARQLVGLLVMLREQAVGLMVMARQVFLQLELVGLLELAIMEE